MYFRNFVNISPLEKGGSLHLNKFESLLTKDTLCQVLMKLAQWFWRRRFFKNINVFSQFGNYLLLEKGGSLHLNKFESLLTKDTLCQVLMKLAQWFWRRRFLKNINVFSQFGNYFLLEKGGSLHLNKFESPLSKDTLCQVLLKLAQWFWRRRFYKNINVFSQFRNYLPLEKGMALYLNKLESLYPRMLCAKFC